MPPKRKLNSTSQAKDTEDSKRQRVEESPGPSGRQPGNAIKAQAKPQNRIKKVSFFDEKYDTVWKLVLPHLPLENLNNFYKVNRKTQEIVKTFLLSGTEVRLPAGFLMKPPSQGHIDYEELFEVLVNFTRNLAFIGSGSYGRYFFFYPDRYIIRRTRNLQHLTLENFVLSELSLHLDDEPLSYRPKSLKMVRSRMVKNKSSACADTSYPNLFHIWGGDLYSLELAHNDFGDWPFDAVHFEVLKRLKIEESVISPLSIYNPHAKHRWIRNFLSVDKSPTHKAIPLNTLALKAHQFTAAEHSLDLPNLKRLSITVQRPAEPQEFPVFLTGLEHYTLEGDWKKMAKQSRMNLTEEIIRDSPQLKTIELPGCPENVNFLFEYEYLQSLTFTTELSKQQIKRLEKLQEAKTNLIITYPNNSNGPFQSQILELLEDCLLLILSHLAKEDMMTIRQVNKQFRKLFGIQAARTWKDGINIDKKFILKYPFDSCMDIYESIGRGATTLNLEGQIPEGTVILLLQLFPRIKTLHLNICGFKKIKAIDSFPRPEELHLTGHSKYFVNLYEHFRPSLKRLTCHTVGPCLNILHDLEEFTTHNNFFLLDMSAFWEQNQSVQSFGILLEKDLKRCDSTRIQENWKRVGELPHLKTLELIGTQKGTMREVFHAEHLSQLASLRALEVFRANTWCRRGPALEEILRKIGPLLKDLTIRELSENEEEISRFKNIERLHVHHAKDPVQLGLRSVAKFQKLMELQISNLSQLTDDEELVSFLHKSNRTLRCNGITLPLLTQEDTINLD